jgi:putative hydrolase of the HAD superfamily
MGRSLDATGFQTYLLGAFFDFGDTLIDETTEVKGPQRETLTAELLPGAPELLTTLRDRGIRLGLIADGLVQTYENVLRQHGLADYFDTLVISQVLGSEKPDPMPFQRALSDLGIPLSAAERTVMVGNRLDRDVAGSNRVGMISVWLNWSPRYGKHPACPDEVPDYTAANLFEVRDLLLRLHERGTTS